MITHLDTSAGTQTETIERAVYKKGEDGDEAGFCASRLPPPANVVPNFTHYYGEQGFRDFFQRLGDYIGQPKIIDTPAQYNTLQLYNACMVAPSLTPSIIFAGFPSA